MSNNHDRAFYDKVYHNHGYFSLPYDDHNDDDENDRSMMMMMMTIDNHSQHYFCHNKDEIDENHQYNKSILTTLTKSGPISTNNSTQSSTRGHKNGCRRGGSGGGKSHRHTHSLFSMSNLFFSLFIFLLSTSCIGLCYSKETSRFYHTDVVDGRPGCLFLSLSLRIQSPK